MITILVDETDQTDGPNTMALTKDGQRIGTIYKEYGTMVSIGEIPSPWYTDSDTQEYDAYAWIAEFYHSRGESNVRVGFKTPHGIDGRAYFVSDR